MTEPKNCPFCAVELDLFSKPDVLRRFWRHPDGICCLNGFIVEEYEADLAAWNCRAPWTVTRRDAELVLDDRSSGVDAKIEALGGRVEG